MNLTRFTDYSLRTLLYLAQHHDRLCTITEISEWYGISRNHLVKVVNRLGQLGYVTTLRGKGGGLALSRTPDKINIGEVVRNIEPNFHTVECFDKEHNTCRITEICSFKSILAEATENFLKTLDSHTLASVNSPKAAEMFLA